MTAIRSHNYLPAHRHGHRGVLAVLAVLAACVAPAAAANAATSTSTATTTGPALSGTATTTTTASVPTPTTTTVGSAALTPAASTVSAYWLVASDGGIFSFGGAPFYGSTGNIHLNQPIVGMAATSPTDSGGYREVASDGGIFDYGDAQFYGSTGNIRLNKPIVGMAATPSGHGYWLVASDGGIFSYGDAQFYGSTGNIRLNKPIVGMAATPSGHGYWLVASDGGIFSYGDAQFYGSTGNIRLNKPIVGMAATPSGHGYWLVASDGGIFSYGDAEFSGSLAGIPLSRPLVGMATNTSGTGYWFTNNNGGVTAFGGATYWGSSPQVLAAPVVGIARAIGTGQFSSSSYPSGSQGYDISNYQCGGPYPPSPHTVSIVQVVGASYGSTNPCLASEANWAGGGLNLYTFLTYGETLADPDPNCAAVVKNSCNYGFGAGIDAYNRAAASGINLQVAWWLDVETYSLSGIPPWSVFQAANASLIEGYMDALHSKGINNVGIYASPGLWPQIAGSYTPNVPYWAADYGPPPATTCNNIHSLWSGLPTGPVEIVQYGVGTYDEDYAC